GGDGIQIDKANKRVIGEKATVAGDPPGNLISGNTGNGIPILGNDKQGIGNMVWGNLIGTTRGGDGKLGNTLNGVYITSNQNTIGDNEPVGHHNVISDNRKNGILIGGAADNKVKFNFIGTTRGGDAKLGNYEDGIAIENGATNNIIGGALAEGNVISGSGVRAPLNRGHGVRLTAANATFLHGKHNRLHA